MTDPSPLRPGANRLSALRCALALAVLLPLAPALAGGTSQNAALQAEAPFLARNNSAMSRMMADMSVTPTGDIDKDFVDMMVPHHQGAIDMAELILRYGHNEKIRRLAQEIIVTQQQEIAAMRLAVGEPLPPSVPSPAQPVLAAGGTTAPHQQSMPSGMAMK